jgi:hypothetical protein
VKTISVQSQGMGRQYMLCHLFCTGYPLSSSDDASTANPDCCTLLVAVCKELTHVDVSALQVHGLQREVGRRTGRASCLVYGALPPEARRHQAQLFNGVGNKWVPVG